MFQTKFVSKFTNFCQCFDRFFYILPNRPKTITKICLKLINFTEKNGYVPCLFVFAIFCHTGKKKIYQACWTYLAERRKSACWSPPSLSLHHMSVYPLRSARTTRSDPKLISRKFWQLCLRFLSSVRFNHRPGYKPLDH